MSAEATENDDGDNDLHQAPPSEAILNDELAGDGPWKVHGTAIGAGDVTKGRSGIRKKWPGDELEEGTDSLEGRPLVRDHKNTTKGVVGEVTKVRFKEGVGVLYQAELDDEELAKKVARGRLEVSARIRHKPVQELEVVEGIDAYKIEGIKFENLSLVPRGASSSNTLEIGEHDELSAEELAEAFGEGVEELVSYHTPDYSSTESGRSWDGLNKEDFNTDNLSEIDDHFIESDSGFPPDTFSDLAFPVVDTDGALVLDALKSAWSLRGHADNPDRVGSIIKNLAEGYDWSPEDGEENAEQFDDDVGEEVEEAGESEGQSEDDEADEADKRPMLVAELSDTHTIMKQIHIDSESLPEAVEDLSNPVVVNGDALEELEEEAQSDNSTEELEAYEKLEDIREEKEQLEAELSEYKKKAEEIGEVKEMYAEELAESSPFEVDDLKDFDLATLREKVDALQEEEEEAETQSDPDPRGGDVDEEELGEEDVDEEAEERIEELEGQLEWYEKRGWDSQAETVREELSELKDD